ncbi:MAG: hypothetical protein V4722_00860 [Bacteroidota bacterium]
MKKPSATIISTILLSVILFFFSLFAAGNFYDLIIPASEGLRYQVSDFGDQFRGKLILSAILALAPILVFLTWKFTPIIATSKRFATVFVEIISVILAILLRQQMIKSNFKELTENLNTMNNNVEVRFSFNQLHFEYYILAGLCAGCILSFFLFRQKQAGSVL